MIELKNFFLGLLMSIVTGLATGCIIWYFTSMHSYANLIFMGLFYEPINPEGVGDIDKMVFRIRIRNEKKKDLRDLDFSCKIRWPVPGKTDIDRIFHVPLDWVHPVHLLHNTEPTTFKIDPETKISSWESQRKTSEKTFREFIIDNENKDAIVKVMIRGADEVTGRFLYFNKDLNVSDFIEAKKNGKIEFQKTSRMKMKRFFQIIFDINLKINIFP